MAQMQTLVLFSTLLTLRVSTAIPEVWVQVQTVVTNLPFLAVRCGVLGCNHISLATVSWKGFVDAEGSKLAVLHPELGTQQWAPASQAQWDTPNSISVTLSLEQSKARSSLANTTFCCEFVTFPHGSTVTCGDLHSSDPGLSAPTPTPILKADLSGILGTSGVFLFGFIFILCVWWRKRHWCFSKSQPFLTSAQAQMETQPTKTIPGHWPLSITTIPSSNPCYPVQKLCMRL